MASQEESFCSDLNSSEIAQLEKLLSQSKIKKRKTPPSDEIESMCEDPKRIKLSEAESKTSSETKIKMPSLLAKIYKTASQENIHQNQQTSEKVIPCNQEEEKCISGNELKPLHLSKDDPTITFKVQWSMDLKIQAKKKLDQETILAVYEYYRARIPMRTLYNWKNSKDITIKKKGREVFFKPLEMLLFDWFLRQRSLYLKIADIDLIRKSQRIKTKMLVS